MRHVVLLVATAALVLAAGCSTQQSRDAALATAHLVALQDQYGTAHSIYATHIDDVPDPRRAELQLAWGVVELLHDRLQTDNIPALAEALALYEIARPAWVELRAEALVLIQTGTLTPLDRVRLIEIDRRSQRLDEAVTRLAQSAEITRGGLIELVRDLAPLVALVARAVL